MFRTPLIVEADSRPDYWIVRAALVWDGAGHRIAVPAGFETDLASVPRMVQGLPGFASTGLSRRPAVLHDYLYASADVARMEADRLFYEALKTEGVGELTARLYYDAVRVGGRGAWDRHRAS